MGEGVTTAVGASATAAIVSGRPPGEVIVWAIVGALVAVWLSKPAEVTLTAKWFFTVAGLFFVSATAGVVLSSILVSVVPSLPAALQFLAAVPHWASAAVIAALIHKAAPLLWRHLVERFFPSASKGDSNAAG